MEKRKLTESLKNFTVDQNLSAELFFVLKNVDNNYELFSTIPEASLIKEMIKSYTEELAKFSNAHSPYELHSIYSDNENNWNYLYFDTLNTTKVSTEIFGAETNNLRPYSTEIGDYGSIFGFVIDIYNGNTNKTVRIFKKAQATQAMKTSRVFGISFGDDGKFKSMEKDAIFFQKNIDLFKIGEDLLIRTYNIYETNFKFDEVLKKRVAASLKVLLKVKGLEFTPEAIDHVTKLTNVKRKKLINCVINNVILTDEKYNIIKSQGKKYLKHEFKISLGDKIIINTKKDVNHLITILNREINKNSATNEVFHTPTKKLLSIYIPKKPLAIV